jgi:hypothetical protein
VTKLYSGVIETDKGLGRALLLDAVLRYMPAAEIDGAMALLVHALTEEARHSTNRVDSCHCRRSP